MSSVIHVPSPGRTPHARMTSPNAASAVTRNFPDRSVRANDRETCKPSKGMTPRGSGDHQRTGSPALNHGNTPAR